jgi:CubicO group peptidase (beta-lactamase class C family)/cbb3-type cytochrome oxidase subunit 3
MEPIHRFLVIGVMGKLSQCKLKKEIANQKRIYNGRFAELRKHIVMWGAMWSIMNKYKKFLTAVLSIFFIGLTIYFFNVQNEQISTKVKNDYFPESEWRTSTPEEQGMDSEQLLSMIQFLKDQKSKIHSIVIIRNGYLVLNANFYPYNEDLIHTLQSSTKSVLSALIGISLTEGKITDIQNKVLPYFSDKTIDNTDPLKQEITIQNLLTMTAGFDWQESSVPYGQNGNSYTQATQEEDPLQFELNHPMKEKPGVTFNYNTGATDILSAILEKANGISTVEYAKSKLFEPIGIKESNWSQYKSGNYLGGAGLYLKPMDMARIGYLFLNNGDWKGNQIISKDWVKESTRVHVKSNMYLGRDYGYLWWMSNNNGFSANGSGGQTINVLPDQNMVVVTTGSTPDYNLPTLLLDRYIVPSLSSKTLQKESPAYRVLQEALHAESNPPVSQSSEIPSFAKAISGKTYYFENGNTSYTFHFSENQGGSVSIESNGVKRTRNFGFNGIYMNYNDPSEISITNTTMATVTFDKNAINLQLKALQSYADTLLTFTFDNDTVKLKFINLYSSSTSGEVEGKLTK